VENKVACKRVLQRTFDFSVTGAVIP